MLERIADALDPTERDTVLEIGPGRGALTDILAPRVQRLVAVELDRALAGLLRERYAGDAHVAIVEGDFLHTDPASLVGRDYLLVGNVPYYITTPILFHTLERDLPRRAVFLVQQEVAERAAAPPGSRSYGALSVNLQVLVAAERVFGVSPTSFRPPPKVDSAVLRLTPLAVPLVQLKDRDRFRSFVKTVFSQRRKQIATILRGALAREHEVVAAALANVSIDPSERPERLSPAQFVALFEAIGQREG